MILWNMKRRLSSISRQAKPDREFVISLQKMLGEKGYLRPARSQVLLFSWRRAAVFFSLAGSLLVGTGTYAYVSPDVLPDHPLYGLRTTIEQAELTVARNPEAKAKVQLKQLRRHLQEERLLADRNQPLALAHTSVVLNDLSDTVKAMPIASSSTEDGADDIQAEEEADARATVAMDRQALEEMADDQKDLSADEAKIFNRVLKDQVDRTDEHVQSLEKLREGDQNSPFVKRFFHRLQKQQQNQENRGT